MNAVITTLVIAEGVSLTLLSVVLWRQGRRHREAHTAGAHTARVHQARIRSQQPEVDAMAARMTTRG